MRLIIVGSRTFSDYQRLCQVRVLNYGGMLALLGAEKMMHTLPTVWPQGVWGTS